MRVSVIIPTHNEAQAIKHVLADLPADLTTEVIVVDSNSSDGTPEIAAGMGSVILRRIQFEGDKETSACEIFDDSKSLKH